MVARINPSKKEQLKIGSGGQIRRVNIGMLINFFEAYAFGHLRNFSKSEGTFDPTIFEMAQKKRVSSYIPHISVALFDQFSNFLFRVRFSLHTQQFQYLSLDWS